MRQNGLVLSQVIGLDFAVPTQRLPHLGNDFSLALTTQRSNGLIFFKECIQASPMESLVPARTKLFLKNAIFRSGTDLPQSSVCAQTFLFKESALGP